MNRIRLLATDLDGTIITARDEFDLHESFRKLIGDLRTNGNAYWAISTGRSLSSYHKVFAPLLASGLRPDYVVTRHAFIHSASRYGYVPHIIWNMGVQFYIWRDVRHSRRILRHCLGEMKRNFRRITTVADQRDRICIKFADTKALESAANLTRAMAGPQQNLQVFEYLTHLDIRTIPHTKGLALCRLAMHLGIPRSEVLAVGDGHNDMSMLDGSCAVMSGCPANACVSVMETVSRNHGHLASRPGLEGTIEAINAHLSGNVNSELPASWAETSLQSMNGIPGALPRHREHEHYVDTMKSAALILASAAAAMLALASQGLLGGASRFIMKPFEWIVGLLAELGAC